MNNKVHIMVYSCVFNNNSGAHLFIYNCGVYIITNTPLGLRDTHRKKDKIYEELSSQSIFSLNMHYFFSSLSERGDLDEKNDANHTVGY